MPEYQISHASTKAIAASRGAGARDVGLGSDLAVAAASPVPLWCVRLSSDSWPGCRRSPDLRSVPGGDTRGVIIWSGTGSDITRCAQPVSV